MNNIMAIVSDFLAGLEAREKRALKIGALVLAVVILVWWLGTHILTHRLFFARDPVDDAVVNGDVSVTVSTALVSADPSYNALPVSSLPLLVLDNDVAGVAVTLPASHALVEGETLHGTRVSLTSEPAATVQVRLQGDLFPPVTVDVPPALWATGVLVSLASITDDVFRGSEYPTFLSVTTESDDLVFDGLSSRSQIAMLVGCASWLPCVSVCFLV